MSRNSLETDNNLVGAWEFQDDAANTNVANQVGPDATGYANTNTFTTAGPGGSFTKALDFSFGASPRVDLDQRYQATGDVTLLYRGKREDTFTGTADSIFGDSGWTARFVNEADGSEQLNMRNGGTTAQYNLTGDQSTLNWHAVAIVVNNTDNLADFYFDGDLVQTGSAITMGDWYLDILGNRATYDQPYYGSLCDLAFFDRALSPSEVSEWYNSKEPINSIAPTINGNTVIGSTLTCNPGTWDSQGNGALSYSYQWLRNDVEIIGATSSTWVSTGSSSDIITCRVAASNDGGNDSNQDTVSSNSIILSSSSSGAETSTYYAISATGITALPIENASSSSKNGNFVVNANISNDYAGGTQSPDSINEVNDRLLYRFGRHRRRD